MKLFHVYTLALTLLVATGSLAQTTQEVILGGDDSPAVLFDGTEISQADLAGFEASQIGDIRILTGDQAIAEYGKYGAHGVIVVTGKAADAAAGGAAPSVEEAISAPEEKVTIVSKDPYVIIDGQPSTNAQLQTLNPEQIETVNVLKGEKAVAKYGQKGADGVIEVVTKE